MPRPTIHSEVGRKKGMRGRREREVKFCLTLKVNSKIKSQSCFSSLRCLTQRTESVVTENVECQKNYFRIKLSLTF